MIVQAVLIVAGALFCIGLYGAMSQRSLVSLMMGVELMVSGAILALAGLWATAGGGSPKGSMLAVVFMTVMAVEMAVGLALLTNAYRVRRADATEDLEELRG